MDLNTILCRGRADMYGTTGGLPTCHFRPVVSSFKMDSLRASVRKDKPESRTSSRRSSGGSPGSPSKSILRGYDGSPKHGSPSDNRSVRFRDGRDDRGFAAEYSKIHVNETTQTNGWDSQKPSEPRVQVYSSGADGTRAMKDARSSMESDHHPVFVAKTFKAPPVYTSTPRFSRDESPSRSFEHTLPPEYVIKQQRELPKTPVQRVVSEQRAVPPMAVRKAIPGGSRRHASPTRHTSTTQAQTSPRRGQTDHPRYASATQTPQPPSGNKIIQNMDFGGQQQHSPREYVKSPRIDLSDGRKIIQNMDFGHIPYEKSIGIQTHTDIVLPNEVGIQTEIDNEVGIQTEIDAETQTPRDAEVQTPRDVSVQTPRDEDFLTADDASDDDLTGDISSVSHAFSQTVSDEEEEEDSRDVAVQTPRDVGVQTPRDVGVQTPREVSIQTSDTSDEDEEEDEDTADVASQTPTEHDANPTTQGLDTYTNVWSTTQRSDEGEHSQQQSSFLSSGEDEDSRLVGRLPRPSFADMLTEVSDDEEVDLPPHLIEPFPNRESVHAYDKLKTPSLSQETSDSKPGVLIEHSARQLLERATSPIPHPGSLSSKSTSTRLSPTPKGAFVRRDITAHNKGMPKQLIASTTNVGKDVYQVKRNFGPSQAPEELHDAGTQFHSDYHLALQAKEDRLKDIATTLDFTPIESHSFDPGSKKKPSAHLPAPVPDYIRDIRENQLRNALIKDVDLGPLPPAIKDPNHYNNRLVDFSPPKQRIVKSVEFDRSVRDRYRDNKGPNYIFFKNTPSGSKYDSFDPQPRQSARRPHSSYTSPPRASQYRSRPSSAPAKPRQSYPPTSSYLTPALNHMRKQAIRKSGTYNPPASSRNMPKPSSKCHISDTFISSTKPPPQRLTLPLTNVAPSVPMSPDIGSFETLGNQPRFVAELTSTSNCRPEPKRKSRTPSPAFRLQDRSKLPTNKRWNSPEGGNHSGFATSCKPPIPRGRNRKKDSKSTRRNVSSETRPGAPPSQGIRKPTKIEPRARSVDSHVKMFRDAGSDTDQNGFPSSRDHNGQPSSRDHHGQQRSRKKQYKQTTTGTSMDERDKDHLFFGNEAIQKIIEKATLSSM